MRGFFVCLMIIFEAMGAYCGPNLHNFVGMKNQDWISLVDWHKHTTSREKQISTLEAVV